MVNLKHYFIFVEIKIIFTFNKKININKVLDYIKY